VAALRWIYEHAREYGASERAIAVAGDSSGGNFAAVISLLARDGEVPPVHHQLLLYPALDGRCSSETYNTYAENHLLTADMMKWFWHQYSDESALGSSWRVSPVLCEDFRSVAPATIYTAECDVLRSEAEVYARGLVAAGVDVAVRRWSGQIHGFLLRQGDLPTADAAAVAAGHALRAGLSAALAVPAAV
jgi:acetyl esterase